MNKETFGQNLKKLRQAHGLTQSDLADAIGISWRAYIDIEHGKTLPRTYERYEALARCLHVDISDLWSENLQLVTKTTVVIKR